MTTAARSVLVVPELGPALGRLVAPPGGAPPTWVPVEDLREGLVTQLFALGGDARRWAREGDRELALGTLDRAALEGTWHRAVEALAQRVAEQVNARLLAAAREARLPAARTRRLALEPAEVRAIAARLAQGDAGFREALRALELAAAPVRPERAPVAAVTAWQDALLTAARRLESAWLGLLEALAREGREWDAEVQDLRRWRRPGWPLYLTAAVLFGVALYVGLVLGGYLPVPGPVRPFVEELWAGWS